MTTRIHNLVVFGDSMSDIGNKRETGMGRIARGLGLMRTNKIGRYSDRKNWADFLWEWAGGATMIGTDQNESNELTKHHRPFGGARYHGAPDEHPFSYANYAQGGDMGASDRPKTGLETFNDQYEKFMKEPPSLPGTNTLHIVWFGLNDLVTNNRHKQDMWRVAVEICAICEKILERDPRGAHFMFVNLPNPAAAVRFSGMENTEKVRGYQAGAQIFNRALEQSYLEFRVNSGVMNRASLVDIYKEFDAVTRNLDAYDLRNGAQPKGVKVQYKKDYYRLIWDHADMTTTRDKAHPTEAAYRIIAQVIATQILEKYKLGNLKDCLDARFTRR